MQAFANKQSLQHSSAVTAVVIAGLMLVIALWSLGQLLYQMTNPQQSVVLSSEPASIASKTPSLRTLLTNTSLFGVYQASRPVPPVNVPATRLQLTLKGIVYSDIDQSARAIITGPDGREGVYDIGDAVPGGARLDAIHTEQVILMRAGKPEALSLHRERIDNIVQSSAVPKSRSLAPVSPKQRGRALKSRRDLLLNQLKKPGNPQSGAH